MIIGSSTGIASHEIIYDLEIQLTQARIQNWIHQDLFTFQWWLLLLVLIVPWFIWWKYVDKKRVFEIAFFGAIMLIISSFLDAVLTEIGLWCYEFYVIPVWPRLISADFTLIPITYMFIYQYIRDWKRFCLALVIVSTFFSFIGEPFLMWLNIYHLHGWKHIYSFPIYVAVGVLGKWLLQFLNSNNINPEEI